MSDLQPSRRTLVQGLAAGTLALPVLAACGTASSPSESAKVPAGGIATSEIPVDGGKIFGADQVAVSQPAKGTFKAFSNICTHQGCAITDLVGTEMVCGCHGSKFSILDGSVKNGPATQPLQAKKVTVNGGKIVVA